MAKGSNQYTKRKTQASTVCYVCVTAPPTLTDDVGGRVCQDCHTHMQVKILEHVLKSGYRIRARKAQ